MTTTMPETVLQKKPQSRTEKIQALKTRREHLVLGGGADKLDKQRAAGKLTARERISALVDTGSFPGNGLVRATSRHAVWHGRQGNGG